VVVGCFQNGTATSISGGWAGGILGVVASSGTRWISLDPNNLITIAAVKEEGNFGGWMKCCFDEDASLKSGDRILGRIPKWEE
jgi:hypothetical protein